MGDLVGLDRIGRLGEQAIPPDAIVCGPASIGVDRRAIGESFPIEHDLEAWLDNDAIVRKLINDLEEPFNFI